MGRLKCNTVLPCQGTHFTFDERIRLQHYLLKEKITNRRVLGELLGKSKRTIIREIKRGLVFHTFDNIPFEKWEYNAQYAELMARDFDSAKGPGYKIGRDRILLESIAVLIKECKYSPYAVIKYLDNT